MKYLNNYEDLNLANISNKEDCWKHWNEFGKKENRKYYDLRDNEKYKNFDWIEYLNNYEDLRLSNISNKEDCWKHWNEFGKKENRKYYDLRDNEKYQNFDWNEYLNNYKDLKLANISNKEKCWKHWNEFGKKESRKYYDIRNKYLDWNEYIENNSYKYFDWQNYLKNNQDIKLKIFNKKNALLHWSKYRIKESRKYYDTRKYFFIYTAKNSGDYIVAKSIIDNNNSDKCGLININTKNNFIFNDDKIVIFLDHTMCHKININSKKIAWVRNWERKWLPHLKKFDYVFCCTNKAKNFFNNNGIRSYVLPIGANFENLDFNKNKINDIFVDCNLFNRRKIVDIILRLKKETKFKIKISGKNWKIYLSKEEFELIKDNYYEFMQPEDIKEEYLSSKIIIDDCNINTIEFGSVNKRVIDCISCKRLVLTNNLIGSKELFENSLVTFKSYDEFKKIINNYLKNTNKYDTIINKLYSIGKKSFNNKNFMNNFNSIINNNLPNNQLNVKKLKYFFINLNRRKDRLDFMNRNLKKINIKATRIQAIDGINEPHLTLYNELFKYTPSYFGKITSPGAIGLIETWRKLLLSLYNNDSIYQIVILEDDIYFHKNYNNLINNIKLNHDIIYLGSNQHDPNTIQNINGYYEYNNDYIYGTYGMILNKKAIRLIYDSLPKKIHDKQMNIDCHINQLYKSKKLTCSVLLPNLIIPNLRDSDNMDSRDLSEFSKLKKWDLSLYDYSDFTKFVIIIPSYNNSKWYQKNLDSVLKQTYKNWRIVYVDDCSTDNTYNLVKDYIKNKKIEKKVTLIRNKTNMKQAYSRYIAFKECHDDEICCLIDGDDWLYDNNVLNKLNKIYCTSNCMVTYSDYIRFKNGKLDQRVIAKNYSNDIKNNSMYRISQYLCTPLRTGYAKLFKNVRENEMKDHNGNWLKCSTDMALLYRVMEQSKGKIKVINDLMYVYNIDNSLQYNSSYYKKDVKFEKYREEVIKKIKYSNYNNQFSYKFNLPERNDNKIHLIYYGTLRNEENILEIIEEFKKIHKERPEVLLKIVYEKIQGNKIFKDKVNDYIKNGVKGITFKHNLSHIESCYEISTSDIGICWRKNGWGYNGEVSTKVKKYQFYGLEIINNMKIKVGVVTSINKLNNLDNIIQNFKKQLYFNKKLFLVLNNNNLCINNIKKEMIKHNILHELIIIDEKFNLGHCLNQTIRKLKEQNYHIFSKFDDNDIYEKNYLLEQVYHLNINNNCVIGKYNIPLFIPEYNNFYTIKNFAKNNQFTEMCYGSTISFNINNIKHCFNTKENQGVESIFLKEHINNGHKIYVTSINNYIFVRNLDYYMHTWKLNIKTLKLIKYIPEKIPGHIFNVLFDKIYVITLPKSKERKQYFIQNNNHTEINFYFFNGVDGVNDKSCKSIFDNYMNKPIAYDGCSELEKRHNRKMLRKVGQIGYLKSMLNIFKHALTNNYKRIMVFDDDVILHKSFNYLFFKTYLKLMEKDIIRIGTTDHNMTTKKSPYYISNDSDGSFAICYKSNCFDYFIKNIQKYNNTFDTGVLRDYKKHNKLCKDVDVTIYPFLAIADTYESTITNETRNLFTLSKKLEWNLNNFIFKGSTRKISVIFPLYNKEKTIILSIQSILNQSYSNIEIIIVDDRSTDSSVQKINNFLKDYTGKIKIILIQHEINKGYYAARNTGIKHAKGDYIAFQDPNDFSLPNRLQIQMQDIITKNVSISFSQIYRMNNNDVNSIETLEYQVIKDKALKIIKESNWQYSNKLGMVTSLIDINIFKKYGFYLESIRHSLDLWYLQQIYIKRFNLDLEKDIYKKVNVTNKKEAFHSFISKHMDKNNFIYYNESLQYICNPMNENNITNIDYNRDEDYEIIFKEKKKLNIKFGEKYIPFSNPRKYKYDFTYKTIKSSTNNKIYLFKNVFYKIICENKCWVYLSHEKNLKDNIFRGCLSGKNLYFTVNTNGLYYLKINTKKRTEMINIENYISVNYICGDNVFMLNSSSQKDKFKVNAMILSKFGIKINRFEAINGYDKKYDNLWNKIGRKTIISREVMGYLLSMEQIFSSVKSSYVCIFDDNILFSKDFTIEKLTEILVNFSDFNILKFGASQWNFDNIANVDNVNNVDNFYYPNELSNGSFACIYNPITFKSILKKIRNFNDPFDGAPLKQYNNNKSYVLYPNQIITNLSDISTITNKTRDEYYKRFKWNIYDYIKIPYIKNKKVLKNNNDTKKLHFLIGITTFKRTSYLKKLIKTLILTLKNEHFFTIIISKGLDLLDTEDNDLEKFLLEHFKQFDNIKLIINYSYLHYIYNTSNMILKISEDIKYNFGFILNDDVLLYNNWYMTYYNSSKINKMDHLCWLQDRNTTTIVKNKNLKHNGSVLNANGVLLTFTKKLVKNVGFFNETDFKVRGQSHIEWSLRCCNKGYNNKYNFYDVINSNELIKLNFDRDNYTAAISKTKYVDKVMYYVDKYELERRNNILNKLFNN